MSQDKGGKTSPGSPDPGPGKDAKADKKKSPSQKRAEAEAARGEWTQEAIDAAMLAAGGTPKGTNPEPPSRGPGRPPLIDDIDLEWVQRLAAGGLTKYEISAAVGISETTRKEYENRYPAFAAAIARGRARDINDIVDALHKSAKGYTFMEEKLQYDTQVGKWARETAIKHNAPDVKAALAILQHAETGSWKPKTETELKFPEPLIIRSLATGQPIEFLGLESLEK